MGIRGRRICPVDARRDDVMRRATLLGFALAGYAALVAANPPSKAGRSGAHGALAYHEKSGAFGFSFDFPAARAAQESALAQCGQSGCLVMVHFRNSCAALVQGENDPLWHRAPRAMKPKPARSTNAIARSTAYPSSGHAPSSYYFLLNRARAARDSSLFAARVNWSAAACEAR